MTAQTNFRYPCSVSVHCGTVKNEPVALTSRDVKMRYSYFPLFDTELGAKIVSKTYVHLVPRMQSRPKTRH